MGQYEPMWCYQVTSARRDNLSVSLSVSSHPHQAESLLHNGFHDAIDNRVGMIFPEPPTFGGFNEHRENLGAAGVFTFLGFRTEPPRP